jgi:hypothetical protein
LKICSDDSGDGLYLQKLHSKNEQIDKAIPLLAQAFANGFFTEVNCRSLLEDLLDQLAHQVYRFFPKTRLSIYFISQKKGFAFLDKVKWNRSFLQEHSEKEMSESGEKYRPIDLKKKENFRTAKILNSNSKLLFLILTDTRKYNEYFVTYTFALHMKLEIRNKSFFS